MRFTYRKIETALDRISKTHQLNAPVSIKNTPVKHTSSRRVDLTWLFWAFLGLFTGVMAVGFTSKYFEVQKPERFEKVRVTYHEEPIEKHTWLDEKLIEIKTISW